MLIKATLLTELTKQKEKREKRRKKKDFKKSQMCMWDFKRFLRPAGGVKHSDSDLVETRMLSAKKALR